MIRHGNYYDQNIIILKYIKHTHPIWNVYPRPEGVIENATYNKCNIISILFLLSFVTFSYLTIFKKISIKVAV